MSDIKNINQILPAGIRADKKSQVQSQEKTEASNFDRLLQTLEELEGIGSEIDAALQNKAESSPNSVTKGVGAADRLIEKLSMEHETITNVLEKMSDKDQKPVTTAKLAGAQYEKMSKKI